MFTYINLIMKIFNQYILIIALTVISCFYFTSSLQAQRKHGAAKKGHSVKDSIRLNTVVLFTKEPVAVKNEKTTYVDVVKFNLQITNGSLAAIPDPMAYHGAQYIRFYINGKLHTPKVLYREEDEVYKQKSKFIASGASQTFYCDWLRSSRASLQKQYGNRFVVQWSYVNIRSKKVTVNLVNNTTR